MKAIHEFLQKHKLAGWAIIGGVLLLAALVALRPWKAEEPYSPARMTRQVTVKFTDTNEEVQMRWGEIETELRRRPGQLKPDEGLTNPKTSKHTGFTSQSSWREMIDRINRERQSEGARKGK